MTNREAMEIVLNEAELNAVGEGGENGERIMEAVYQMQDYMNDLMREEPSTGCDYGIGG